jgi:hypothetical protein
MIGEVVGRERMSTAMSLDVGASNASRMVGPAAGGFLLGGTSIQGAFILSVLMYCTALGAIITIRSRSKCRSATLTSLQVGEAFLLRTTGTNLSMTVSGANFLALKMNDCTRERLARRQAPLL